MIIFLKENKKRRMAKDEINMSFIETHFPWKYKTFIWNIWNISLFKRMK